MASTNTSLSLLARGIGEERVHQGHKKLEVCLEPEDYHNIQGRRYYLPPIQQKPWPQDDLESPRQLVTHKTFTTRKGALLLYSEDLAMTTTDRAENKKESHPEDSGNSLNTFHDLRSAILSYGAKDTSSGPVYLGFVHNKHSKNSPRNVRPGFSARRYLSSLSRSWDDSVLSTLRNNGHILDKNLFHQNILSPQILRRINDDLSSLPAPYRVTRNMLMAPGSPVIYEFYRIGSRSFDSGHPSEEDYDLDPRRDVTVPIPGSIAAVVRDNHNKPHAVPYANLAPDEQHQILQRLLLQSAMHKHLLEHAAGNGLSEAGSNASVAGSRPVTGGNVLTMDIRQAVSALVNTNTSGLLDGHQAFDDKGFRELYKQTFHGTDERPHPSVRKGLTRTTHNVHIPTLPPILSSSPTVKMDRHILKLATKLPQIAMEPPTPLHPRFSSTESRKSSSLEPGSEDTGGSWLSEGTNIWKADIDEEELLKVTQSQEEDKEDVRDEMQLSEDKSSPSSKSVSHQRALSKHGSTLSSISVSLEDLVGAAAIPGSTKHQSINDPSASSHGEPTRSIKGSQLPDSLRESMRSYKGGKSSTSGSIVLAPDGEVLSIGGGVGSGADLGSSVADAVADNVKVDVPSGDSVRLSSVDVVDSNEPLPQPIIIPTAQFGEDLPESKPPSLPSMPLSQVTRSARSRSRSESLTSGRDPEDRTHLLKDDEMTSETETDWPSVPIGDTSEVTEDQLAQVDSEQENIEPSSEREPSSIGSAVDDVASPTAPSQLDELEDCASVVAALVLERPKSGRDLAQDAEYAAELWIEKLSDLFNLVGNSDRVRSAIVYRHRNSLDSPSSVSSSSGHWSGPRLGKIQTKMKKTLSRKKKKRFHSAEAAVNFIKNATRGGLGAGGDATIETADTDSTHSSSLLIPEESRANSAPGVRSDHSAAPAEGSVPSVRGDEEGGPLGFDVRNYGVADKTEQEKQAPIVRPVIDDKPTGRGPEDEELARIMKETGLLEEASNDKGAKSLKNKKGNKTKMKPRDEFVVKKPQDDKVGHLQNKPAKTETQKGKPKKTKKPVAGKKTKKKSAKETIIEETKPEEEKIDEVATETSVPTPPVPASPDRDEEDYDDDYYDDEQEEKPESPEFIFIHDVDRENTEPEIEKEDIVLELPKTEPLVPSIAQTDFTADSELTSQHTEDSASQEPNSMSRSQAKAAKRAAEAERRKQAVERKRKEREDAKRKQLGEAERQEKLRRDFEEEKRRKEEEVRLKREREQQEHECQEQRELERQRQAALLAEREKKRLEDYKRKMEEIARQKHMEEERRREEAIRKQKETEEKRKVEEMMLAAMAEEERQEYERQKQEQERIQRQQAEEERLKRELLASIAQEAAAKFALELAQRQKEIESRLLFNKSLQSESNVLAHSQDITPAFTWSYFELLQFLGMEIPEHLLQYETSGGHGDHGDT